jgi:O-antigen ligase
MRRIALLYTLGRFGLFVVLVLLVWGASGLVGHQLKGLPLLLVAALLSSLLGYVLFSRQRQALAQALDAKRQERAAEIARQRARLENES